MSGAQNESSIRDFIHKLHDQWRSAAGWTGEDVTQSKFDAFVKNCLAEDFVIIRPSGNPLNAAGMYQMYSSGDVQGTRLEVVSIDSIRFLGGEDAAVVTFTQRSTFTYKDTPNDDVVKFSIVLERSQSGEGDAEGQWKAVHMHRSTGQAPAAAQN